MGPPVFKCRLASVFPGIPFQNPLQIAETTDMGECSSLWSRVHIGNCGPNPQISESANMGSKDMGAPHRESPTCFQNLEKREVADVCFSRGNAKFSLLLHIPDICKHALEAKRELSLFVQAKLHSGSTA